jgi:Zn-dependent protease
MDSGDISLQRPPVPPLSGAREPLALGAPPARPNPFGEPVERSSPKRGLRGRIASVVAAVAALGAKFFAVLKAGLLLLGKIKLLGTAGTALVSVAAYALFWPWTFAAGFVVLMLAHEMGHVIQLRREGIKASAPMFVPFFGAAVMMKQMPDDALAEARVGLAGPVLGTLGAGACFAIAEATGSDLLRALAYVGFFLNLINLMPVVPFDGGRAMAAMAPWLWFVGLGALVALLLLVGNPFLLIFVALGVMETWRRWEARRKGTIAQAAYYRVSPRNRLLVAGVYLGLIVALVLGMHETHVLSSAGHTFRSI